MCWFEFRNLTHDVCSSALYAETVRRNISGSLATVAGLSVLGGAILLYAILDYLRSLTYQRLAGWLAGDLALSPSHLSRRSLSAAANTRRTPQGYLPPRDFPGGAPTAGLEIVWTPLFFGALFLMHPYFGWLGLGAGSFCSSWLRRMISDQRTSQIKQVSAQVAYREIGDAMRCGEVIDAMGMLGNVAGDGAPATPP